MIAFLSEFHFLRPWWLLALLPAAVLVYLLARRAIDRSRWQRAVDADLLPHLLDSSSERNQRLGLTALFATWLVTAVALAGPVWERLPQPVQKRSDALVVVLDLSLSMYAQDLTPSRLVRARHKIADVLRKRAEGSTALVVYAGDAHAVTPLTDDTRTIVNLLPALEPAMMPELGSRASGALGLARELLVRGGHDHGRILLITDEISNWHDVADNASADYPISILGVGTEQGGPIPLDFAQRSGHLKDDDGVIAIARLNIAEMRRAADAAHGRYATITVTDQDIDYLLSTPLAAFEDDTVAVERQFDVWADQGYWLALLALPVALWAFRRGLLAMLLVSVLIGAPRAHAGIWDDLWQRRDQQGYEALEQGDAAQAATLFERDDWRGAALYRDKRYGDAAEAFSQRPEADDHYNRGNALAKAGELQQALKAYTRALQIDPQHEDAAFNKALIEKLLQQQQRRRSRNQNGNQDQSQGSSSQQAQNASSGQEQDEQQSAQSQQDQDAQNQDEAQQQAQQRAASDPRDQDQGEKSKQDEQLAQAREEERRQALEQWLERVPDDPGGLLRRKFRHETQQRYREGQPRRTRDKIW